MRRNILYLASFAAVFGALFLVALSLALIAKGNAGYGVIILILGTPCALALGIVFDYVRAQMERLEEVDDIIDIEPIKPKFTKYGGGG